MKQFVIAGTLVGALACGATAFAQAEKQPPPPKPAAGAAKTTPAGGSILGSSIDDAPAGSRACDPLFGAGGSRLCARAVVTR